LSSISKLRLRNSFTQKISLAKLVLVFTQTKLDGFTYCPAGRQTILLITDSLTDWSASTEQLQAHHNLLGLTGSLTIPKKKCKSSMLVFWVVTPCGFVDRYQRFIGTYCPHLQG
jgi:hypothetical protein